MPKMKKKHKKFLNSYNILLIVFILLIILVLFLSFLIYRKKKENEGKIVANILIPLVIKEKDRNLSLNAIELVNKDDYILKITNYRGDNINSEEMPYNITITNNSKLKVFVRKDSSKDNLMIDQKATTITDLNLKAKKKQEDYYFIKITGKNAKKDDKINITVTS